MGDDTIIKLFELTKSAIGDIAKLAAEIGTVQTETVKLLCDYLVDLPDEAIKPLLDRSSATELALHKLIEAINQTK